jgi:hypothetical protein
MALKRVAVHFEGRNRLYQYLTTDESIQPGDKVIIPGNKVHPQPQEAIVCGFNLDTGYDGPVSEIIGKVE